MRNGTESGKSKGKERCDLEFGNAFIGFISGVKYDQLVGTLKRYLLCTFAYF